MIRSPNAERFNKNLPFSRLEKRQLEHEEIWRKLEDLHLKHTQKQSQDTNNKQSSTTAKRK